MAPVKVRTDLFAGVFLIVSLFLLSLSIWILGSERQIFAKQQPFRASFQDVKGLSEGAPVRLGGIAIGRVAKIGFSSDLNDSRVHVTLLINEDFLERLRDDSEATIETQGLLGDKFVSVSAGTKNKMLPPGSVIKSREQGDFGAVLTKAEMVVENTVQISDSFKKLVEDIRSESLQEITEAFRHIAALSKEIEQGDGLLHKVIYSKKDGETIIESVSDASKSLKNITDSIKTGDGVLHALVYGSNGEQTVVTFKEAFDKIGNASQELGDILKKAKENKGMLHSLLYSDRKEDLDDLLKKLHDTVENLRKASDSLAQGSGTLGALLIDSKVYDNLVEVTDDAKRSVILRGVIRSAIKRQQEESRAKLDAAAPPVDASPN